MGAMSFFQRIVLRIKYPHSYSSDALISYIRKKGGTVGDNTYIYKSHQSRIDLNNARFISIGDNCLITEGVCVLAHDYSYAVIVNKYHDIVRKQKNTTIGNNVFVGVNSVILMGASIGDNTIIGAGSVVSGALEGNGVYAGNPARFICSLDDYYKKLSNDFCESAIIYARKCKNVDDLGIYLCLFDFDKFDEYMHGKTFHGISKEALNDINKKNELLHWDAVDHL